MFYEKEIKCPHCNKEIGITERSLMHRLVKEEILCPYCQKVVIDETKIEYTE